VPLPAVSVRRSAEELYAAIDEENGKSGMFSISSSVAQIVSLLRKAREQLGACLRRGGLASLPLGPWLLARVGSAGGQAGQAGEASVVGGASSAVALAVHPCIPHYSVALRDDRCVMACYVLSCLVVSFVCFLWYGALVFLQALCVCAFCFFF